MNVGARGIVTLNNRKWWHSPDGLSADVERFPTRRYNTKERARAKQVVDQPSAGVYEMLAIIQNQQRVLWSEVRHEGLGQRHTRLLSQAKGGGYRLWHADRVHQRCQLH